MSYMHYIPTRDLQKLNLFSTPCLFKQYISQFDELILSRLKTSSTVPLIKPFVTQSLFFHNTPNSKSTTLSVYKRATRTNWKLLSWSPIVAVLCELWLTLALSFLFFFFFILIRNFQIWHTFTVTLEYLRLMYKYIRMLLRNYNCCRNYVNWYSNSKPFKCTRAPLFMYIYIHRYVIPRGPNLNANSRSTDSWFLVSLMPHLGVGVIKMRA